MAILQKDTHVYIILYVKIVSMFRYAVRSTYIIRLTSSSTRRERERERERGRERDFPLIIDIKERRNAVSVPNKIEEITSE